MDARDLLMIDLYQDQLEYLDGLRDSGETNMFAAVPYLTDEFPSLSQAEARKILAFWMRTYKERHSCTSPSSSP